MHKPLLRSCFRWSIAAALLFAPAAAVAKSDAVPPGQEGKLRYIVQLDSPPLATWAGTSVELAGGERLQGSPSAMRTPYGKLDVRTDMAQAYHGHLDAEFNRFHDEAIQRIGRQLEARARYRNILNGFVVELTPAEAAKLKDIPGFKGMAIDRPQKLHTYRGPLWLGADVLWDGRDGLPQTLGEGVIVGIIDSGINLDHPSFGNQGADGFIPTNPLGQGVGLCGDTLACNNKVIGVYEFVEEIDSPLFPGPEEPNDGIDNDGHGSHVASIAAGHITIGPNDVVFAGVAPHANIISYRVCWSDPVESGNDGCASSFAIEALDQAVQDGVDVINYSIGSSTAFDPWAPNNPLARAFLNARHAGIVPVTSAGNSGPDASTIFSPANVPWIVAVGSTYHDQVLLSRVSSLSRDDGQPLGPLVGTSLTDAIASRPVVHAGDFGSALCGQGPAELEGTCDAHTGSSNPFAPGTFNGEIVVCDRGTYGRIEKGYNVLEAGAGGMILANTQSSGGQEIEFWDDHCLPTSHIDATDGDDLRQWLDTSEGHEGQLEGTNIFLWNDEVVEALSSFSSIGPNQPHARDVLKPNLVAPGQFILGAHQFGDDDQVLSGTSMASPHVAGAAALLRGAYPDWNPAQIISALEFTATTEQVHNYDGLTETPTTSNQHGHGRPRIDQAAAAGLYLDVTRSQFLAADPGEGGDPKDLNLAGLMDQSCAEMCSFTRRATDLAGGATWTASAEGFPPEVDVTITPNQFTLGDGASRDITFEFDTRNVNQDGSWVFGDVVLSAQGLPDAVFPTALFASLGELPEAWVVNTTTSDGWRDFQLDGLATLPDATITAHGLVPPRTDNFSLPQDPTSAFPYDGSAGTRTILRNVPAGSLRLFAETLMSPSDDLDLYVGRDSNGNGEAEESEEVCFSASLSDLEFCDILNPEPGNWWILVQNWAASVAAPDEVTLRTVVVGEGQQEASLAASGPGIVDANEVFDVRVSWSNAPAVIAEPLFGVVTVGSSRDNPQDVGLIPFDLRRSGYDEDLHRPVAPNDLRRFALSPNNSVDKTFVDVPDGVTSLDLAVGCIDGDDDVAFTVDIQRQGFDGALNPNQTPFTTGAAGNELAQGLAGDCANEVTWSRAAPVPGRYFIVVSNEGGDAGGVQVANTMAFDAAAKVDVHRGLWDFNRNGKGAIAQGVEWQIGGDVNFILWYSYDDDGQPAWYIASSPAVDGNTWSADLLRVTNDGGDQQSEVVGQVILTFIAPDRAIFSHTLFGSSGSDELIPNGPNTCPTGVSYTGHWFRGLPGLGGATMLVYALSQAHVHYLFDANGEPRWLVANLDSDSATDTEITFGQVSGFCATCAEAPIAIAPAGTFTRTFAAGDAGQWTLEYEFLSPLAGSADRTEDVIKLSTPLVCE